MGDALYVIVACTGPGVFAGDLLRQRVEVGAGARVVLASQAALQVHPAGSSAAGGISAAVFHDYLVESGGELHCHWDPVIPFAGASLEQRFDLHVAGDARLYWSDALMAGRVGRGERWQFAALAHTLRLRVDDSLAYLERYRLAPLERPASRPWVAGGATYVGTTLIRSALVSADAAAELHHALLDAGVRAAADLVEPRLIVARLLGDNGATFAGARACLRTRVLDAIFHAPELVCRK